MKMISPVQTVPKKRVNTYFILKLVLDILKSVLQQIILQGSKVGVLVAGKRNVALMRMEKDVVSLNKVGGRTFGGSCRFFVRFWLPGRLLCGGGRGLAAEGQQLVDRLHHAEQDQRQDDEVEQRRDEVRREAGRVCPYKDNTGRPCRARPRRKKARPCG